MSKTIKNEKGSEAPEARKEKLLEKQAEELAKFEREESIRAKLPEAIRESALICVFKDHASVSGWRNYYNEQRKFSDALQVFRTLQNKIVIAEHWKGACVSCWPPQINSEAKNQSSTMVGSHAVEIKVDGGRGFQSIEVRFWVQLENELVEIHLPVSDLWKLQPGIKATYNNHGDLASCTINWPDESRCVDSFRQWWSEKPAYHGSYYLADVPNFESWASRIIAPGIHKENEALA